MVLISGGRSTLRKLLLRFIFLRVTLLLLLLLVLHLLAAQGRRD